MSKIINVAESKYISCQKMVSIADFYLRFKIILHDERNWISAQQFLNKHERHLNKKKCYNLLVDVSLSRSEEIIQNSIEVFVLCEIVFFILWIHFCHFDKIASNSMYMSLDVIRGVLWTVATELVKYKMESISNAIMV